MAARKKKKKAIEFQIGWPGLIAIMASTFCVLAWTFVLGFWMGQKLMGGKLTTDPRITALSQQKLGEGQTSQRPRQGLTKTELPSERPATPVQGGGDREDRALEKLVEELKSKETRPSGGGGGLADLPTEVVSGPGTVAQEDVGKKEIGPKPPAQPEKVKSQPTPPVTTEPAVPKTESAQSGTKVGPTASQKSTTRPAQPAMAKKKARKDDKYVALRIASFRQRQNAEKEARRWQAKGYKVMIKRADLGAKGVWYRVFIGRYATIEEAKQAAKRLAETEGIKSYVVPNP